MPRSRFYTHMKGLFFTYRWSSTDWDNPHFNNEPWRIREEWFVLIRLRRQWFGTDDMYYDGHTSSSIIIFGVELCKGYTYISRAQKDWKDDE